MNDSRIVATVKKNNAEEIRVRVSDRPGCTLIDMRVFAPTRQSRGEPRPTQAGICVPQDRLRALIEALQTAAREVFQ